MRLTSSQFTKQFTQSGNSGTHAQPTPTESQIQQTLIRWWALACTGFKLTPEVLMGFPLQGARTLRNGARMKAEGMRRGTPDLFLAVPAGPSPGLWIELKTATGKVRPTQTTIHAILRGQGYGVAVCRSFKEAETIITEYLRLRTIQPPPGTG